MPTECVGPSPRGYFQDGGSQLVTLLRDGLSSWLVMDDAAWSSAFDLDTVLERVHAGFYLPVLYMYDVWPDFRNTRHSIISVSPRSSSEPEVRRSRFTESVNFSISLCRFCPRRLE